MSPATCSDVRRHLSIFALGLAWLCANGALWNVVQVVGWAQMLRDYSAVMPAEKAIEVTFNGSAPCKFCHMSQSAEDTARRQLPRDAELGNGMEKLLLVTGDAVAVVVTAPEQAWPGVVNDAGQTRTESVPVPPPRDLS